jgi:hypothetical protein
MLLRGKRQRYHKAMATAVIEVPPPLLYDADRAKQVRLQGEGIEAAHVALRLDGRRTIIVGS